MRLSKKILLIVVSILSVSGISFLGALGLNYIFGWNLLGLFLLGIALIIFSSFLYNEIVEKLAIVPLLKEYAAKPFKVYSIMSPCQYCSSQQEVELDLSDTEYVCDNCKRKNAVHVVFNTIAVGENR